MKVIVKNLIENMEVKLIKLKGDIKKANEKVDFLINDINKIKSSEEDSNSEEFKENVG